LVNLHRLKRALPITLLVVLGACGDDDERSRIAGTSNSAPVIVGTPATKAVVGVTYEFVPDAVDADEDVLTFAIENRPGWATFSPTTGRLSGRPPASAAARVYAGIRISVSDSKAVAELPPYDLEVEGDPDANTPPTISGTPDTTATVGNSYSFTPDASDPDGQVLTFSIANMPTWAGFDTLTGELSGAPAGDDVGTYAGIVISVSDGAASRSLPAFGITVSAGAAPPPVNRAPVISGTPVLAVTAGNAYSFRPTASDPDGQALTFSINGKPGWATFNPSTGRLSGTPGSGAVGSHPDIVISVSDGDASASLAAFTITVVATNRAPVISGSPVTSVVAGQPYSFQPTASDADGQALTFSISNRPAWASFNTQTGRLSGTPADNQVGSYNNVLISVSDGNAVSSLPAFSIRVDAANRAPVIGGTPATTVVAGQPYSFQPNASDADGDNLVFSISGKPSWAGFDTGTGRLSGTPAAAGTHNGIVISVSDGRASAALATFSISVTAASAPPPPPPSNRAPVISGSPPSSVLVNQAYDFRPTASDPDGDTLSFTIANQPSWASFDAASGRLWGTPDSGDAGTWSGIRITVSDGAASVSLAAFAIVVEQVQLGSATLSWTPPTRNEDGTPLTNLQGYRILYGTSSTALTNTIQIPNGGITTAVVENLSPATWFFGVKAYTTEGVESSFSNIASKRID
jgi:Putative Ig domain